MKEVEKKQAPEVSGGNVLPDTTGLPVPPFPDPQYPPYPGGPMPGPGPGPTWPDPIIPIIFER
jgi:hypothetical protein